MDGPRGPTSSFESRASSVSVRGARRAHLVGSRGKLRSRASSILAALKRTYPDAHCELHFRNPFELLVATILSAQCTDVRVNQVTPALFAEFPDARALASAPLHRIEALIRSTGFFRSKAKHLLGVAQAMVRKHNGQVPEQMNELCSLPGVGRKTANVILSNAFGRNEGVVVDTHVARLSQRLDLCRSSDPLKIEKSLQRLFPREDWGLISHLFIWHGRRRCSARKPECLSCEIRAWCPTGAKKVRGS